MSNNRCQYIVNSKNLRGQLYKRKCYNVHCKKINYNNYCFIHINKLYEKYVNLIIKHFKGYYIRKKIYYYKLLPCDVQYKIIYKMRENFYIDHYNCSISKILHNKVKSFNQEIKDSTITKENLSNLFIKSVLNDIIFNDEWANSITDKLFNLHKLLNKFKLIISNKTVKILNYLSYCSYIVKVHYHLLPTHHPNSQMINTSLEFYNNFYHLKLSQI